MHTPSSPRSPRRALVGLVSLTLVLGACGGGDDGAGELFPTDTDATEQTSAPDTTAASSESGDTEAGSSDAGDGLVIPDLAGLPAECQRLAEALSGAFGGTDAMSPTGSSFDMFGPMSEAFRDLKGSLPSEYDADLDIMAEAFAALDKVLAEYDYDLMQAMVDPSAMEALEALDDAELQAASERLGEYFNEVCDIEP